MDLNSLRYLNDYVSNRMQRVRINNDFSQWKDIIYGVPQGSILDPLFFNIYIIDLFYFTENVDMTNYADYTTHINEVISTLQSCSDSLFRWVSQNFLKANPDNSHIILSEKESKIIDIQSE